MTLRFLPLRAVVLSLVLLCTGGCGVELAMIGAAASAASQGSAVYKRGKLNASWMGPFDMVVAAGEVAGTDLGLSIKSNTGNPAKGQWVTLFVTDDGDKISVKTTRKTQHLTEFQINVGWFGEESTARLLLKRMAVAINLDANHDGSGEVITLPPPPEAPPTKPAESETIPSDDPPVSGRGGTP